MARPPAQLSCGFLELEPFWTGNTEISFSLLRFLSWMKPKLLQFRSREQAEGVQPPTTLKPLPG